MGAFADQVRRWSDRTQKLVVGIAREAVSDLHEEFVERSPVKTGRFQSNFVVSYGSPNTFSNTNYTADKAAAHAQFENDIRNLPLGQTWWIVNNVEYGPKIEFEGWSRQAPVGVVRTAVLAGRWAAIVDAAARSLTGGSLI